jgi:hypothetical protein
MYQEWLAWFHGCKLSLRPLALPLGLWFSSIHQTGLFEKSSRRQSPRSVQRAAASCSMATCAASRDQPHEDDDGLSLAQSSQNACKASGSARERLEFWRLRVWVLRDSAMKLAVASPMHPPSKHART